MPPASWIVRRGPARRFVALKENRTIPLCGIRRQIERNHYPYHLVKRNKPHWIRNEVHGWGKNSRLLGLKAGQMLDKEVENAVRNDSEHVILTHLEKRNLFPIAVKVLATNAEIAEDTQEASCAEIDMVAFNRETGRFACVEIKRTTKSMQSLEKEEKRSPRCRRTKRKRHFMDMARLQAQLGAMFLKNTYDLEDVEAYLFVVSKNRDTDIVDDINLFQLKLVDEMNVNWIAGYDEQRK